MFGRRHPSNLNKTSFTDIQITRSGFWLIWLNTVQCSHVSVRRRLRQCHAKAQSCCYHPLTKLRRGYVFSRVCLSTGSRVTTTPPPPILPSPYRDLPPDMFKLVHLDLTGSPHPRTGWKVDVLENYEEVWFTSSRTHLFSD